jgi:argininosuccinate synthase
VKLLPYRFELQGIDSPNDLMNSGFGRYGEETKGWTGEEVKGFTAILGNALKIYYSVNK